MFQTNKLSKSVYQFSVLDTDGNFISLEKYQNNVLLIVNTASECAFTPQYGELEELYSRYHKDGFEILAFPSNDFGKQEPLSGNELKIYCEAQYHTTFPLFEKVQVSGAHAIPLFQFLSNKKQNGKVNWAPKWNFQKYLVNRNGEVVDFFFPFTKPTSKRVTKAIERLL